MTLDELAIKYGTDKSSLGHNYMPFYEKHLPEKPNKLLEIGVKEGRSIQMWKEYFPNTQIFGVDLFIEFPVPDITHVVFRRGNQLDHRLLYDIRNNIKPNVIVEDGSHNSVDQWVTMISLIPCCDQYYIEDLSCCRQEFYRQGLTFEQTVLGAMLSGKFPFNFILSDDQKIALITP